MEQLTLKSKLVLNKKTFDINEVIKLLYSLPTSEVVGFFQSLSLNMPRRLRMDVIKQVLNDKVKQTRAERDTLADELNYRLKWFKEYSDTQSINLLNYYNLDETNVQFMESFWLAILNYIIERGVSEKHLSDLFSKAEKQAKKHGIGFSDIKDYNEEIDAIFYDAPNHLDGLSPKKIRPVLFQSSTLVEIREIGKKYGVDVPRRLKKQQLLQIIFDELEERKVLNEELKASLSKKSVIAIQRYATDHDIKVSTELKKEEIIEYILENAHQTKESYFKPETSEYHLEVEEPHQQNVPVETNTSEMKPKSSNNVNTPSSDELEPSTKKKTKSEEPMLDVETASHSKDVDEEVSESSSMSQGLVINAARYRGSKIAFEDDYLEFDGAKALLSSKERKQKVPGEIRFIWKLLVFIFIILLRIVAFAAIIVTVVSTALIVYGSIVHFADIPSLDGVNDLINSIDILGKGILEHIAAFYSSIGLK